MATTYDELVKNIKAMSGRTDPTTINAIPSFIIAAQTKLDSVLRVPEMIMSNTTEANGLQVPLPFLEIDNILIGGFEAIMYPLADVLIKRQTYREHSLDTILYAVNGNNIELVAPAVVTITGYQMPVRLSSNTQTNAYTGRASNALMWASLAVLGVFIRDTDMQQSWAGMADNEIANLNEAFDKYKSAGGLASEYSQITRYL